MDSFPENFGVIVRDAVFLRVAELYTKNLQHCRQTAHDTLTELDRNTIEFKFTHIDSAVSELDVNIMLSVVLHELDEHFEIFVETVDTDNVKVWNYYDTYNHSDNRQLFTRQTKFRIDLV